MDDALTELARIIETPALVTRRRLFEEWKKRHEVQTVETTEDLDAHILANMPSEKVRYLLASRFRALAQSIGLYMLENEMLVGKQVHMPDVRERLSLRAVVIT